MSISSCASCCGIFTAKPISTSGSQTAKNTDRGTCTAQVTARHGTEHGTCCFKISGSQQPAPGCICPPHPTIASLSTPDTGTAALQNRLCCPLQRNNSSNGLDRCIQRHVQETATSLCLEGMECPFAAIGGCNAPAEQQLAFQIQDLTVAHNKLAKGLNHRHPIAQYHFKYSCFAVPYAEAQDSAYCTQNRPAISTSNRVPAELCLHTGCQPACQHRLASSTSSSSMGSTSTTSTPPLLHLVSQLDSDTWAEVLLPKLQQQGSVAAVAGTCSTLRDLCAASVQSLLVPSKIVSSSSSSVARLPQRLPTYRM